MTTTKSNDWMSASSEKYEHNFGEAPTLTIYDWANGGRIHKLRGEKAIANSKEMNPNRDSIMNSNRFRVDDYRDSYGYGIGRWINHIADPATKTWPGRILDKGMLPGGLLGAGTGLVAGKSIKGLLNLVGVDTSNLPLGWIGSLGGGALGALLGYLRTTPKRSEENVKQASMYQDPRNFILEKLQGAHDISSMDKMQLASKVRNMSKSDAERLKGMVRSAMGAGVGAIIARFFFGAGFRGMVAGALIGAALAPKKPNTTYTPAYLKTGPQYYLR